MGMYYLFYEAEEWKLLIYNFRQELMVWKFAWGYWGKAYGWFYGLGSGKDGRKEHWKEVESMNAWMAQEWHAERGKQCVAFKKCMRKSSGRRIKEKENFWMLREKGSRGGGTDEIIEKFMRDGRWWWLVVTMWEGVRERESVKLCLNICTWSDRLEWDLETKSTSMLVLPHHCHPHPSREGMTNPDDAMSWWKHSTAEWKGTCFMECEGE